MIADLKPYPLMKDSGLPWLGEVPEHWWLKRGKNLFRCIDVRSSTGDEELLTVSSERGVVPRRSATVTMFKAESYVGHKLCWPGDLVINSLWAWARGLGVSQFHGIVSTAYGVYRLRAEAHADSRFIHELVRSTAFHWELQVRSKGVWTSRLQLTDESFLGAPFPLPALPEQSAIVRFLDHAERRIRRYIRIKQKLIALLEEQKQAIIHRAVTHGLDPNVRLKPSGVGWFGEMPKHWSQCPIKRLLSRMDYGTSEAARVDGKVRVLTMGNIQQGEVTVPKSGGLDEVPAELLLSNHDLLFTRTNGNPDLVGKVGLFRGDMKDQITFASYLVRLRVKPPFHARWLHFVLNSWSFWAFARSHALVNLQTNLNSTRYGQFFVPVPPPEEQRQIVDWIESETRQCVAAATSAKHEIALLREYRIRLIADVVTGKLDVRAAAAKLPDKTDEPEPLDEAEALAEGDEETVDADLDAVTEEAEA